MSPECYQIDHEIKWPIPNHQINGSNTNGMAYHQFKWLIADGLIMPCITLRWLSSRSVKLFHRTFLLQLADVAVGLSHCISIINKILFRLRNLSYVDDVMFSFDANLLTNDSTVSSSPSALILLRQTAVSAPPEDPFLFDLN